MQPDYPERKISGLCGHKEYRFNDPQMRRSTVPKWPMLRLLKPAKPQIPPAAAVAPSFPATPPSASLRSFAMLSHPHRVRARQPGRLRRPARTRSLRRLRRHWRSGRRRSRQPSRRRSLPPFTQPARTPAIEAHPAQIRIQSPTPRATASLIYPANHPHTRLHEAIRTANQAVFRPLPQVAEPPRHGHDPGRPRPKTLSATSNPLACPRRRQPRLPVPSRPYLDLLTQDHSPRRGADPRRLFLNRVQARRSAASAISSRGPSDRSQPSKRTSRPTTPSLGDLYLLASDGLTRELTDAEIAAILTQTRATGPHRARSHLPGPGRRRQPSRRPRQHHRPSARLSLSSP